MTTPEDKNNLENNEVPKVTPENLEQKEISQEELLNYLDNEEKSFKNETSEEINKSNSVDLDQPTFEKIKNETGVEEELNTINQEAEKYINEARQLITESEVLQKNPVHSSFEGIDLMDTGEDQKKKIDEMVSMGKISAEEVEKIKSEISNENIRQEEAVKNKETENLVNIKKVFEKFDLSLGKKMTLKDSRGFPVECEVVDFDKDKGIIGIAELNERGIPKVTTFYNPEDSERLTFDLNYKSESLEKNEKPNIEQLIQSVSSLPELYKVIQNAGGIQGSSENYSAEQIWERIRAYVNNQAEENIITRTGGLREKVKELKAQRETNKNQENPVAENKEVKEEKPESFGEGFKTVKVKRSNGEIEDDWKLMNVQDGQAIVMKKDKNSGELLRKVIPENELAITNQENQSEEKGNSSENTLESIGEFTGVSYELWKETLPDVHLTAGSLTFRPDTPSGIKNILYFMDTNGDHYVSYTETDGTRQARKLYMTANNAGISQEVDPSVLDKNTKFDKSKEVSQDVLGKSYLAYVNNYNSWSEKNNDAMNQFYNMEKTYGAEHQFTKEKKQLWDKMSEKKEETANILQKISNSLSVETKNKLGIKV